jgi:hypothetical protein
MRVVGNPVFADHLNDLCGRIDRVRDGVGRRPRPVHQQQSSAPAEPGDQG